jgi:hypothetical protein
MIRLIASCLVLLACLAAWGCGDDAGSREGEGSTDASRLFVTLSEAEAVIEEGALAVVRTGGDADVGGVDGEPDLDEALLVDTARYATQSGREFDLFVFATPAAARRGAAVVINLDERESGIRVANVVTVFPRPFNEVGAYRAVARALRRLQMGCDPGGKGSARLRRICADDQGAVPPPGEGVDRDEAQDEEDPVVVGGLHYDPQIARRLNPKIAPDRAMLSGRTPPPGQVWFGVFVRVCNRSERVHTSSDRLTLVDAFGQRTRPSDVLAPSNAFAYKSRAIKPGECLPQAGSVAERSGDGLLVLFAAAPDVLGDPPIGLEVDDELVILDL